LLVVPKEAHWAAQKGHSWAGNSAARWAVPKETRSAARWADPRADRKVVRWGAQTAARKAAWSGAS